MSDALARILARPIAHRGLHGEGRVENALAAVDAAIAAGFGIECDVQRSRDNKAIVFHDDTLERLTTETGPVAARDMAALTGLHLQGGPDRIPTLTALLDRVAGRVPVIVEIKSGGDGDNALVRRVVAVAAGYRGPIALKSFDAAVVAACRNEGARCPLGLVGTGVPPSEWARRYDFLSWRVDDLARLRPAAPGAALMAWTVRSEAEQARAARHGAQIVFEHYCPTPDVNQTVG